MSEVVQGEGSNAPVALPLKRRRGRPRKDPSLKRVARPQVPRVEQRPEIPPRQIDLNHEMIGQAVTGVVEAGFGDGFLLSVRLGDSNTNYRGVVLKPGHFDPVTAQNDVAPHIQMIRRMEVRSAESQLQVYGHNSAGQNGSLSVVSRSPKGKQAALTIHPSVPPVGARGTVIPVVLQPVKMSNGLTATQDPRGSSHVESIREKDVQMVDPISMLPPVGSVTTGQVSVPPREIFPLPAQVSEKVAIGTGQKEDGSANNPAVVQQEGVKPILSTNITKPIEVTMGFQGFGDVTKGFQGFGDLSIGHPPGIPARRDMNQFPPGEPRIHPLHTQAATSGSKPLMNYGTGRMTELLQAVQENLMENQMLRAGDSGLAGSKSPKMDNSQGETSVQ